jgi:chromosome segregation ATPase
MTDAQQIDLEPTTAPAPKKSSGYRRLQVRHHSLLVEHEVLKAELAERDEHEAELQASIERLLEQHQRLMQTVRAPQPQQPWFEGANQVLAQLAQAPDQRSLQMMTATLAGLQQRLAQIIMRMTP